MSFLSPIEARLAASWPPQSWCDVTVLAAVSGGVDSVALLRALAALKTGGEGRLYVGHFNHGLRGGESEEDERFVGELCRQLDLPCKVGHVAGGQAVTDSGDGLEAAARATRYEFLQQTAARLGARYVVTAHTADDQAETILHRIIRGTGIGGLAAMVRARPLGPAATLIRPLLEVRRSELKAYLSGLGQRYRSDSSNVDVRFTRNRIRHELLPLLAERFNPGVVDAVLRLGSLAGEVQVVVDAIVGELVPLCVAMVSSEQLEIDADALSGRPRYVIRELLMAVWRQQDWPLQAMGFVQWELLAEMVVACSERGCSELPPQQTFPGNVLAERSEGRLRLVRR